MTLAGLKRRVEREEERALEGGAQWQVILMATPGKPVQQRATAHVQAPQQKRGVGHWSLTMRCLSARLPARLPVLAGVGLGAAEAIVARYPSPSTLLQAVRQEGWAAVAAQLDALRYPGGGGRVMEEGSAAAMLQQLFPATQQHVAEVVDLTEDM